MGRLSKIRKWANRDDGRFYRVGNENISATAIVGMLVLIGALVLGQIHARSGTSSVWAITVGALGLALLLKGLASGDSNGT